MSADRQSNSSLLSLFPAEALESFVNNRSQIISRTIIDNNTQQPILRVHTALDFWPASLDRYQHTSSCPQLYFENIEGANAVRVPYMLDTLLSDQMHAALVGSSGIGKRQTLNALLLHCATLLSLDAGDTLIADGNVASPTIVKAGSVVDEQLRRFAVTPAVQLKFVLIRINRKVFQMTANSNDRVKISYVPSAGSSYVEFCDFVRVRLQTQECRSREIVALMEIDEKETATGHLSDLEIPAAMALPNCDTDTFLHATERYGFVMKVLADPPSLPAIMAMAKEQFAFDSDNCRWAVHDDGTRAVDLADALKIASDRVAVVGCVPRVVFGGFIHYKIRECEIGEGLKTSRSNIDMPLNFPHFALTIKPGVTEPFLLQYKHAAPELYRCKNKYPSITEDEWNGPCYRYSFLSAYAREILLKQAANNPAVRELLKRLKLE